jgi:peptidoglycan/LPS O-acetylase OafA/YrhL
MTDKRRSLEEVLATSHLPALDGLRAVSVFVVMTYHFWEGRIPGDLGVSTFFVLSGFLITWLLLQEWRQDGSISVKNFYFRRTLRIFPAYYCFLAFSFAQEYVRGYYWTPGLVESGLFYGVNYYNAFNGHPSTAIAHAWSLAIEEQFYLLWPMLFLFLSRKGTKAMAWTLAGIIGVVVLWRSFLYLELHAPAAYVYNAFDTRFDNIALGCLIAVCVEWNWFRVFASALAYRMFLPIVTVALLLVSRQGGSTAYHYSLGFSVDAVLIAAFILQMLQLYQYRLWSWLELPIIRYLGYISYPLYLYHTFGFGVGRRASALPLYGQFLVGVFVSVAMASASYRLIERPFLKLKLRRGRPLGKLVVRGTEVPA